MCLWSSVAAGWRWLLLSFSLFCVPLYGTLVRQTEYMQQLDAVAEYLSEWGVVETVSGRRRERAAAGGGWPTDVDKKHCSACILGFGAFVSGPFGTASSVGSQYGTDRTTPWALHLLHLGSGPDHGVLAAAPGCHVGCSRIAASCMVDPGMQCLPWFLPCMRPTCYRRPVALGHALTVHAGLHAGAAGHPGRPQAARLHGGRQRALHQHPPGGGPGGRTQLRVAVSSSTTLYRAVPCRVVPHRTGHESEMAGVLVAPRASSRAKAAAARNPRRKASGRAGRAGGLFIGGAAACYRCIRSSSRAAAWRRVNGYAAGACARDGVQTLVCAQECRACACRCRRTGGGLRRFHGFGPPGQKEEHT